MRCALYIIDFSFTLFLVLFIHFILPGHELSSFLRDISISICFFGSHQ